jgi:hypothetical protein
MAKWTRFFETSAIGFDLPENCPATPQPRGFPFGAAEKSGQAQGLKRSAPPPSACPSVVGSTTPAAPRRPDAR